MTIPPAKLLLDEMFSNKIALGLTEVGVDCRSVSQQLPHLAGADDSEILKAAIELERILVTNNVGDFEHLRRDRISQGLGIPDIIYTSDASFPRNRDFNQHLVSALERAAKENLTQRDGGTHWLRPTLT